MYTVCMYVRFVSISLEIFLNFFSTSPRKSSIASESFVAASVGGAVVDVEVAVWGRDWVWVVIVLWVEMGLVEVML